MLNTYLQAIKVKLAETVDTEDYIIHFGYYKTIQRQLVKEYLTQEELNCILSLYDVDYIPSIDVVVAINIEHLTQPLVEMEDIIVLLPSVVYMSQPSVTYEGIMMSITHITQPSVVLSGITLSITHLTQPLVSLLNIVPVINIEHLTQPLIELEGVYADATILHMTQPSVVYGYELVNIVSMTQPQIDLEGAVVSGLVYYGFTPWDDTNGRSVHIAYLRNNFSTMLHATGNLGTYGKLRQGNFEDNDNIPITDWNEGMGSMMDSYIVFLIPVDAGVRSYMISPQGTVIYIGGVLNEEIEGNEFPNPESEVMTINNVDYYVYVSNRRRWYPFGTFQLRK